MSDLRRITALLRPHAADLLLAVVLAGVLASCQGLLVVLVKATLDSLLAPSATDSHWWFGGAIVVLFATQGSARVTRTWLTRRAALRAERDLRNRLFDHLLRCDPAMLHEQGLGDCLSRLSHDAGTVRTAVGAGVTLVQRPLSALAIAGTAIVMAPRLALWAAVALPLVALVIYRTAQATRHHAARHLSSLGRLESQARDGLAGLRTIQAYGAEAQVHREFKSCNEDQLVSALRATLHRISGPPLVELAAAISVAVVLVLGIAQVRSQVLDAGSLVAFLVALGLLSEPLKGIAAASALWQEARAGLGRVFELLDLPTQDLGAPSATRPDESVSMELTDLSLDRGRGSILCGLDLVLEPGQLVVVQGASGAGKSTLLDLIVGFVQPSSGTISWNGVDANLLSLSDRRGQLALVDQECWLGMGTVSEAIALARPGSSRADIVRCAAQAGLALDGPFLGTLPGGLEGRVGDAGQVISGGERQRISLARALLRGARVLLLDEPTANLDAANEISFLRTLRSMRAGRIILIVSHRPGPLQVADRAYRLDQGVLVPLACATSLQAPHSQSLPSGSACR